MTADRDDLAAINRNHADGTPRRLTACAQANPANDDYHPGCCRFPKSCSPYPYAETPVTESDLEPRRDQPPPADRDDLAAIIAKHYDWSFSSDPESNTEVACCYCGAEILDERQIARTPVAIGRQAHRAHVAQMVLESDWLRGVRAKELRDAADDLRPKASVKNVLKARLAPMRMAAIWDCAEWIAYRADRVDAEDTDNTTDRT